MKKQALIILLETINELSHQIEKTSLVARTYIGDPESLGSKTNRNLSLKIVQRYFNEIQKHLVTIMSTMLGASNLWKSFFPNLISGIENNEQQSIINGIQFLKTNHHKKLEKLGSINEILKEYHSQLKHYTIQENVTNSNTYLSFIQEIEVMIGLTNILNNSWEDWLKRTSSEANNLFKEINEFHTIWLAINKNLKTSQTTMLL